MTRESGDAAAASTAWEAYWRLTPEASAHRAGGPQEAALAQFWESVFAGHPVSGDGRPWLDWGCGNGALARFALDAAGAARPAPTVVGLDRAPAAVAAYRARFPAFRAVIGDGRRAPFGHACFGVVASQFGIEYAGIDAVGEAARLVAPGGTLALVMHLKDGALYRECETSRTAMGRVQDSRILALAKEAFRRGSAVDRGQGSRAEFLRAEERFAAAAGVVDGILNEYGDSVAGGTLYRLYADLARMYGRRSAYDAAEVARWADSVAREVDAYVARMAAMLEAAVDMAGLERAAGLAASGGVAVRVRETLQTSPGGGEPFALVMVGERS